MSQGFLAAPGLAPVLIRMEEPAGKLIPSARDPVVGKAAAVCVGLRAGWGQAKALSWAVGLTVVSGQSISMAETPRASDTLGWTQRVHP